MLRRLLNSMAERVQVHELFCCLSATITPSHFLWSKGTIYRDHLWVSGDTIILSVRYEVCHESVRERRDLVRW
ncbi:hypothetical protein, partial [Acidithiobacillus sp.]|uniref:hypothetical protein n=1 Tax=Acidithiobacillus sp. TaxID=1872118 RepID=UPI003569A87A